MRLITEKTVGELRNTVCSTFGPLLKYRRGSCEKNFKASIWVLQSILQLKKGSAPF
jgi:hypothetical protein